MVFVESLMDGRDQFVAMVDKIQGDAATFHFRGHEFLMLVGGGSSCWRANGNEWDKYNGFMFTALMIVCPD